MPFATFMASPKGRVCRVVVGLVLMGVGYWLRGNRGKALMALGLVPLLAGVGNGCVLATLLHVPFNGRKLDPTA